MADLQAEQQALDERIDGSLCELEAIHRRKTGALLRAPLQMGAVIADAPAGSPRGPGPLRAGRRLGVPDRRRPARRSGGRDQAGQARGQGFRSGQMDLPAGSWASTAAAAGPSSSPTRPWRRSHHSALAATACASWRWLFWKGIVDDECGLVAGTDRDAGRPQEAVGEGTRSARRRDANRADRRGRPPVGSLRQQSRRRRALPGPAPELRLLSGPPDLGHGPPDLSAQADHRPCRRAVHDPDPGRPDGLPQPGREPLRPVHDRARRLRPVHGSGIEGRRRDHGPAAAAFRGRHRRRRPALGHRLRGIQRCQRSEDQAAGHPQRQPDVDLPAGRRALPIISTAHECPRRTTTGTRG